MASAFVLGVRIVNHMERSKFSQNQLKATKNHQLDKTEQNPMNYEMIVLRNVTMVSSITRGVFLSNVCLSFRLSKFYRLWGTLASFWVLCFSNCAIVNLFQVKSHSNLLVIVTPNINEYKIAPLAIEPATNSLRIILGRE